MKRFSIAICRGSRNRAGDSADASGTPQVDVVGVVADSAHVLREPVAPAIFLPLIPEDEP
jgi:hypothetical protein